MKKTFFILMFLSQILFAQQLKVIQSISDIPKNKNTLLIFSMEFCPYCKRQEKSIIKKVMPNFKDYAYLKVMEGSRVFQELIETGNFGEVEYYPTTFILKIDQNNNINVKYPFMGFQRSSHIIDVLNDKEIMQD